MGKIKGEGRERNRVSGSDSHIRPYLMEMTYIVKHTLSSLIFIVQHTGYCAL